MPGYATASYVPCRSATSISNDAGLTCNEAGISTRAKSTPRAKRVGAAGYYDPSEVQVKLTFHAAYTGNLRLYAVNWGGGGAKEAESLTVGGSSVSFSNNVDMGSRGFSEGQWAIFPISEPAGGSLTITVTPEGGSTDAVLSGIFLGDAGAPPALPVSSSPQGTWTGALGSAGYDLAAWDGSTDVSDIPGASLSLAQGSRYVWAANTSDPRALQSPDGLTREAATYFDPNQLRLALKFNSAYTGNLRLYAVDWDSTVRRELVSVDGQTAALSSKLQPGCLDHVPDLGRGGGNCPDRRRSYGGRERGAVRHLPGVSR
jgi:hypothetical protein